MILSDLCLVGPVTVWLLSGYCPATVRLLSGYCPIVVRSCPENMSENMSGMSGNVRENVRNVQSGLSKFTA
eukprot:4826188-Prymnesium_polylepis.1